MLSRYSWTVEYYLNLEIKYFNRLFNAASKNMEQEAKNSMIPPAFLFWLEHIQSSDDSKTKSLKFDKMLEELGLIESDKKVIKQDNKQVANNAIERSKKIIDLDKQRAIKK